MGPSVVPLILEELRREPDHWFCALEMTTDENPVSKEDQGHVQAMTNAWTKWGQRQGLIDAA